MSSTNRSKARESHISDYYKTPVNQILDFLMEFENDYPELSFTDGRHIILDPCAGGRNKPLESMSYSEALKKWEPLQDGLCIDTVDIRKDSLAKIKMDYLSLNRDKVIERIPDVIITNPPFSLAQKIIIQALKDVSRGGLVIMLLRLNFFGSQERAGWWHKNMPFVCYVHSKRMKFFHGGTDSIEYMHCIWIKDGKRRKFTKLRMI